MTAPAVTPAPAVASATCDSDEPDVELNVELNEPTEPTEPSEAISAQIEAISDQLDALVDQIDSAADRYADDDEDD
jgi:hypothetical protein